jgi:hypothetical protein
MANVNGHAFRRGDHDAERATLCLETRGREIVATIFSGAVERAMFGKEADPSARNEDRHPVSSPHAGQPLQAWD